MSLFPANEFERRLQIPEEAEALDYCKPTDICWKCGGVLDGDDVLVYVHGCEGSPFYPDDWDYFKPSPQIWLHLDCAHDLALELLKDYLIGKEPRDRKEIRAELGLPPLPED